MFRAMIALLEAKDVITKEEASIIFENMKQGCHYNDAANAILSIAEKSK
jgi:hypothetical protein